MTFETSKMAEFAEAVRINTLGKENCVANTVKAKYAEGWNMSLAQLFGSGPKWTITCGNCSVTFRKRIPMVANPGVSCPHCGAVNTLPLTIE